VEKKSRRMELALYCLSHAAMSCAACTVEWGLVRPRHVPERLDVVMFAAAAAAIMHCYSDGHGRHRDVFRSKYLNYLDFVFGSTGARLLPAYVHCMLRLSTHSLLDAVMRVDRMACPCGASMLCECPQ